MGARWSRGREHARAETERQRRGGGAFLTTAFLTTWPRTEGSLPCVTALRAADADAKGAGRAPG
ncbi:hypothetical protein ACWGJW_24250, partial [Streptomyces nigrescens]